MNVGQYDLRKYLTRIAVMLMALLVLFVCYDNLSFRLKSTSPPLDTVADSSTEIRYFFSQPVKSVAEVSVNDLMVEPIINGKEVVIPLNQTLVSGREYTITMSNVRSEWFNMRIGTIERSFLPRYIEFDKLSAEEQQIQVDNSNSGQIDDPFISKNNFPVFNDRWQIDAVVDTSSRTAVLNVKFFEEIPNYDQGGVVTRVTNETAEKYRQEVLKKIKDDGGNPDNYMIIYDNPYLYEKYSEEESH